MEFLNFLFSSVWHFAGFFILLCTVGYILISITSCFASGRNTTILHVHCTDKDLEESDSSEE